MNVKRVASAVIGLPVVAAILILGNKYVIDVFIAIVAIMAMYEFFHAISKKSNPVKWLGYIACASIAFVHVIPIEHLDIVVPLVISGIILILFLNVLISKMKINFNDIAYTLFGILYIPFFLMFFPIITGMENGKILIWYIMIASWVTDIFAYIVGKYLGKHKFSKISPKKTIEGCIGGTLGAVVVALIYTWFVNSYFDVNYSYMSITLITVVLSIISQIGDFSASTIKRYVEIKDYSEVIPGHGGILDRIDSLLFITPFAYVIIMLLQI